ncbi:MAG: hypothetical protein ABR587_01245 [Candidatus Binatia bacterium]
MDHFTRCYFAPFFFCCLLLPVSALAQERACGLPVDGTAPETTTDSLYVLNAAVEVLPCNICVCDVNSSSTITASDALLVLQGAVGLPVTLDCPDCDPADECPVVAQFALFAGIRGTCATNAECAAFSVCDPSIGRCRTRSETDVGWTGISHNFDLNDPVPARVFLDCQGPAPCGECTITGHDPSLGNCRCDNDNRQRCFTVAGPDELCGGGNCTCNFGPPLPLNSANVPVCVLNTLAGQPDGMANVDQGSGTIGLHLREKVFSGLSNLQPCPICINDTTPADGMRDGVCVGGLNDTESCDAQAGNTTFPPPTGALYSLDCFPLPEANIAGPGLSIEIDLTTGRDELHAKIPCAVDGVAAELDCPCRVCSGDFSIPCDLDSVCEAAGAGTCSSNGNGEQTLPNACTTGVCEDAGDEEGLCAEGPDDTFCDGIVRADGTGLLACQTNSDCEPGQIGVDGGECGLVERRPCFLDPIVTEGAPHPVIPFAGGTFCSPATTSQTVNIVAGFPGPGRLELQSLVSLLCGTTPQTVYTPGSGGCP